MTSCELVTFVSSLACSLANCYSDEDLAVLAAALTQLGDTLTTILAHNDGCKNKAEHTISRQQSTDN